MRRLLVILALMFLTINPNISIAVGLWNMTPYFSGYESPTNGWCTTPEYYQKNLECYYEGQHMVSSEGVTHSCKMLETVPVKVFTCNEVWCYLNIDNFSVNKYIIDRIKSFCVAEPTQRRLLN